MIDYNESNLIADIIRIKGPHYYLLYEVKYTAEPI